jgi:formylglycine-generating enzyme required for sulfatase activity
VLGKYEQREEDLAEFWIARTPVTCRQYERFLESTGRRPPKDWPGHAALEGDETGLLPVTGVSWEDAAAFAERLGARLPTHAEFEKAARGEDGRLYPWGGTFDAARCNAGESRIGKLTPVGSYPEGASPRGVLDLSGTVWEWTADDRGEYKLIYGGSYRVSGEFFGASFMIGRAVREMRDGDLGFRVACDKPS